ncbi:MAG: hypothetical protein SFU86_01860 [Pirellulaceae bacterium]|nr:hypothetical protein [Pirellulaceae bacterium]
MSLFEDSRYQWRETYFVLFEAQHRPPAEAVKRSLTELGPRLEVSHLAATPDGLLESLTVLSHADAAGMDITYVTGDEVAEQLAELKAEWKSRKLDATERARLEKLLHATARFDIYHFEEVSNFPGEEDEGPLDPGTLLLVLKRLAHLCHGQSIDPQSGEFLT